MSGEKITVGILSLNMYTTDLNYACRVHSYAFQQFLEEHGINAVIIDYLPIHNDVEFDMRHPLNYYIAHPKKNILIQKKDEAKWSLLFKEREERFDKTKAFIDKYFVKTEKQYTTSMLDKVDPGFDIYIAATDVLWKYREGYGFDKGFFLQSNCMKEKGKIAYAVSYGGKEYDRQKLDQINCMTQDIDFISTREKYLYDTLYREGRKDISLVLDPVFLQKREFYDCISQKPEETNYVLVYNVMKNSKSVVDTAVRYAEYKNLKVIELSSYKENENFPNGTTHKVIYGAGIEEWLGYIKYAECIFTNSFHGSCFSIIFNKNFYAGERGGTKISWLLEIFALTKRWIEPKIAVNELQEAIDYDKVNKLVDHYRDISAKYILNAIEVLKEKKIINSIPKPLGLERVLLQEEKKIVISYNSTQNASEKITEFINCNILHGSLKITQGGSYEYSEELIVNRNRTVGLMKNLYEKEGYYFVGWNVRHKNAKTQKWEWLCEDFVWREKAELESAKISKVLFHDLEKIRVSLLLDGMIFVAVWEADASELVTV